VGQTFDDMGKRVNQTVSSFLPSYLRNMQ